MFHGLALMDNDGEGVLFFGLPNTGKTTIASEMVQSHKYKLISDDLILLRNVKGSLFVYPINNKNLFVKSGESPKFTKTDSQHTHKKPVPVRRLYVLDEYDNFEKYLISKIYNINRLPHMLRNYWVKCHKKAITNLLEIKPENIQ